MSQTHSRNPFMFSKDFLPKISVIVLILGSITLSAISMGTPWRPIEIVFAGSVIVGGVIVFLFSWHGVRSALSRGEMELARARATVMLIATSLAAIFGFLHILDAAMYVMDITSRIPAEAIHSSGDVVTADVYKKLYSYAASVVTGTIFAMFAALWPMVLIARHYERLTRATPK
jgi:hypothetical protein